MNKNFYITTPIYYVNDVPHIGSAYTTIACDVIARFKRLDGYNVKFMTGTDEHGQKVEKSAMNSDIDPQSFTDKVSEKFREAFKALNISNDVFIRTTENRHKLAAQAIWKKLEENGCIYLSQYSGWYCVRDEAFYTEDELIDGKAPTGAEVEWVSEDSYFFNLSKWQDKLLRHYEENPDFITPASRRNEVISFVKSGLRDLSISRTTFKWGIQVPNDPAHIMYVWLDALTNYLTVVDYPNTSSDDFKKFWPADIHMVGKDIVRFHAVYWPAFLMAADIKLPKQIVSHGWWLIEGEKMSKSLGNVVNPLELINKYSLDSTRYYLMREIPFGNDGNFSNSSFVNRNNSELANNIGNLAQRTLSMIFKNCEGKIPTTTCNVYNEQLLLQAEELKDKLRERINKHQLNYYIEDILQLASAANAFIDFSAPWNLRKNDINKMKEILYILAETIRYIAIALQPITPDSANALLDQLNVDTSQRDLCFCCREYALVSESEIKEPKGIFARFDENS